MKHENDSIFNLFSDKTKKILINCQNIAKDLNSSINTNHLLFSLAMMPNTLASDILKQYLTNNKKIHNILSIQTHKEKDTKKNITQELESILKIAADNIVQNNQQKINPEDLLWGIVNFKKCAAYKTLSMLNIKVQEIRNLLDNYYKDKNRSTHNISIQELYLNQPFPMINDFFNQDTNNKQFIYENPWTKQALQKNKKPKTYLEEFGVNLTTLAKEKKLEKVIGRQIESKRLIQILCRKTKNNPVLVGDPGVGKTAIIEFLAQKIASGNVPYKLLDKEIIRLDLALLVAGTMYRGQFETRIKKVIDEIKNNPKIILFIDEIHTIIGAGSAEGSMDASNILKPVITRGEVKLIGATTFEEYRKHIEKDPALERRLQKIKIDEPTIDQTIQIIDGLKNNLEKFHQVKITNHAVEAAAKLSSRYINDRFLPDKAIDVLDEAAASTHLSKSNYKNEKINYQNKMLRNIIQQKEKAIEQQNFPKAAYLRSKELKIKQNLIVLKQKEKIFHRNHTISEIEIAKVISSWTNIPINNLIKEDLSEIKKIKQKILSEVIGQNLAVSSISDAIKKTKTKLVDPNRPLGSFIFLGPTGVGKTHLARTLAKIIFGSEKKLIKIDMSEFMEKHNSSRLVGAPPGYIGYDDAGKLTEMVRNNPYSVILLDEIEKAHPDVHNLLLQIMEDGYLTDSKGRNINFKNTIIIMTSNIGAHQLNKQSLGFSKNKQKINYLNIKEKINEEIKNTFKPEFINRIDNIVIFKPLSQKSILKITELELNKLSDRLKDTNIKLIYGQSIIKYIAKKSYSQDYGAREIRRVIDKYITKKIAEHILTYNGLKQISLTIKNNSIGVLIKK
jgi:ATP-dependent Clp protease ATP-binding subunit ClpC